jgi:hypothetical protein
VSAQLAELEARLIELVRSSALLMNALTAAREVEPPDWLIGSGAIRDRVWNHLHGYHGPSRPQDVDLVFFDDAPDARSEQNVLDALRAVAPHVPWDVQNQATVHLWYPQVFGVEVDPLASSADGVGTWPETATAVAIRLLADDTLDVVAPFGLEDLFALVWRRNPRRVTLEEYQLRIWRKRVANRWPRVQVLLS